MHRTRLTNSCVMFKCYSHAAEIVVFLSALSDPNVGDFVAIRLTSDEFASGRRTDKQTDRQSRLNESRRIDEASANANVNTRDVLSSG